MKKIVKINSQMVLKTKETDNNNIANLNNIYKTEKKSPQDGDRIINLNNNHYINSLNNINIRKEDKKFENKNNANNLISSSPINNIKLSNIAKIDVSLDSDQEPKKMSEDPYLIPKDKDHQFIINDDSFDFLVESMKFPEDKKEKNNIIPEDRFSDLNNNINLQYQNLIKNLDKNRYKERDRNRDKEYGKLRNNNNYERNYMPFRNYYNYYGNGQMNDVNSPSGKYPNDLEYKKNIISKKYI
jgi:hypothetical protein